MSDKTEAPPAPPAATDEPDGLEATWTVIAASGLALTVAAFVMVGSRWYPANLGDAYWLYITTGGTLDSMSIVTLGLVALCGAFVTQASAPRLRAYAVACLVLATIVVALYVGLLSSLPEVIREAAENSFNARTVRYGIFRASLSAALSAGLYLWFARIGWKWASRVDSR